MHPIHFELFGHILLFTASGGFMVESHDSSMKIQLTMCKCMSVILTSVKTAEKLNQCLNKLLAYTQKFLLSGNEADQSCILQFNTSFVSGGQMSESTLHYCFRLILYFCISAKSSVARKAVLCMAEMCHHFDISPKNSFIWNKTNLFQLITPLCMSNYNYVRHLPEEITIRGTVSCRIEQANWTN